MLLLLFLASSSRTSILLHVLVRHIATLVPPITQSEHAAGF